MVIQRYIKLKAASKRVQSEVRFNSAEWEQARTQFKIVLAEKERTGTWLSEQMGHSMSTVSRWMTNKVQPTCGKFDLVARLSENSMRLHATLTWMWRNYWCHLKSSYYWDIEQTLLQLKQKSMISNTCYIRVDAIRNQTLAYLSHGLDTNADLMLETMSQSDNKKMKDIVAYIKTTNYLPKIKVLFVFGMFILQHDPKTMGKIYDSAIDGLYVFRFLG